MELSSFLVINQRKDMPPLEGVNLSWLEDVLGDAFRVDTCLRRVWVARHTPVLEKILSASAYRQAVEVYSEKAAYRFLLQVAAGLESAIPGETDIFGQIKEAWKRFDASDSAFKAELRPWIQRIFEDVKEIRFRFLQGVGGASYGSLTRMILGRETRGPILLVGAGQMARSIAPYLLESELWLWNRSGAHLTALLEKLTGIEGSGSRVVRVLGTDSAAEHEAWKQASDVVLCIPSDPLSDRHRIDAWRSRPRPGRVLHLGILETRGTAWEQVPGIQTLENLFTIQRSQDRNRQNQIEAARRACHEKANLRALGGPNSLAHGWEDLAVFDPLLVE